jgi:aminopeptidase N
MVDIVKANVIDFVHYDVTLEPNPNDKSVKGSVKIKLIAKAKNINEIVFSAKYKSIFNVVSEQGAIEYNISDGLLIIKFDKPLVDGKEYNISIEYLSQPKKGMRYYQDHLFTVYHTANWLISHTNINDKASFELHLIHTKNLISVGNGKLISQQEIAGEKLISHWQQSSPIPIYTFGFALGKFQSVIEDYRGSTLSYFFRGKEQSNFDTESIKKIFVDVPDMVQFFEEKSGISLPNNGYKYIFVDGAIAQEAAGFSLIGERYGHTVLQDTNENWFIAHELAHEWWGNSITCANFSHFWLNEGLVQFLVAAYKEHLFGEEAYKKEIQIAISRVNRAVKKGRSSPVAFKHEIAETEINRTMVYSKGALVFYMLRKKLGDKFFWQALRKYSKTYNGKSVTTQNLKLIFEIESGQDLGKFFDRWVYGNEVPNLAL